MTHKLSVEVHCQRPAWTYEDRNRQYSETAYRLYFNNELMIERSWIWNNDTYIKEDLMVNAVAGTICSIKLEPVVKNVAQAKFSLKNLIRNNYPSGQQLTDLEISFIM